MATFPRWLDSGDVEISAAVAVAQTLGSPGSAVVLKLVNNPGATETGIDPLINGRVVALFRNAGETEWKSAGTEWADAHYLEYRITGGFGSTAGVTATGWIPVGANSAIEIPVDLDDDEGIEYEFRVNAPASALDDAEEIALRVESATAEPAQPGVTEASGDGVVLPYRNAAADLIVASADVVENPGGADNDVQVQTTRWIGGGVPWGFVQQLLTIAASTSSTERIVDVVVQSDGTLAAVAGPEETPPATTLPTLAEGDQVLARVVRDDTATIVDADITNQWAEHLGLYAFRSTGLTALIAAARPGAGRRHALVDAAALTNRIEQPVVLTASSTNWLWLIRDGSIAVTTTAAAPADRALLIHEADTDGSGVTVHRDRRELVGGHRMVLPFVFEGSLTAGDELVAILPTQRDALLDPLVPVAAAIGVQAVTPSSGQTRFDVEIEPPGGAFASIFDTALELPEIAHDATDLRSLAAVPEDFVVPGGSRIRVTVSTVPAGAASPPEDAALLLTLYT